MSAFAFWVQPQPDLFGRFLSEALGSHVDLDWKETPEAHIFKFDLPGVNKDDVKLQVHDDTVLHITAHRKDDDDGDSSSSSGKGDNYYKWHCKECTPLASFRREFRLPENAIVDQIKASMRDGVLIVTVPKDQHNNNNKKPVEIAGDDDANSPSPSPPKGLGRFVCCKA